MNARVSILIPCYNADRWIAQAIESALNQTYPNTEVIVVDDGSTDRSLAIIQQFGDKIRWEAGANRGGNVARNRLLELSRGEWVQYLDADDYLLPDKLEKQMRCLTIAPQTDVIGSPVILEHYQDDRVWRDNSLTPLPHDPWILLANWRLPQTAGAIWRRESLIEIQGWREDLTSCQEYDLYLRSLSAGKQFYYLNEPLSVYRQWSETTVCKKDKSGTYQNRLEILDKLEAHLTLTHQLSDLRRQAINQSRFDCARIIWLTHPQWALKIVARIQASDPAFTPIAPSVPKLYELLYQQFGFTTAETIATFRRNLMQLFSNFQRV